MIRVDWCGQLGNQLCQYCLGRILSLRTGLRYEPQPDWHDKRGRPLVWPGEPLWTPQASEGRTLEGTPVRIEGKHRIDLERLTGDRPVHVGYGFWQRWEYYRPHLPAIRQWLALPPRVATDDDALYVHVRRTDYVHPRLDPRRQCVAHPLDAYARCCEALRPWRRLVLVTDDPADPFLRGFSSLGEVTIAAGNFASDFMLLASARRVVISQSTFSWWAALLGEPEQVACPWNPGSYWREAASIPDEVDLRIEDPRWQWID